MSATTQTTVPEAAAARPTTGGVTLARVLRSEWTKLWSLRSTRWSLLFSFIAMAGLGPLIAAVNMGRWNDLSAHDRLTFDSIDNAVAGYHLAQLAIAVLGVLVISGEYSTGMIRSSLMAVPRRLPVLWGKLLVFATVTFVLMLIAGLIGFFSVQAIVTQHHVQHSIGSAGAARVVIGSALYMTVLAVLCLGLGAILRSTAGGIAMFVFLLFVLPGITAILPASLSNDIAPYLPVNAGTTVASHRFDDSNHLAIWTGFVLFCGYTLVVIAGAAYSLLRRDA